MFKLVAIDLDGTLLTSDLRITERTKHAIREAIANGVLVTLATGRMFNSAQGFAKQLNLDIPLITDEGSMIKCVNAKQSLFYQEIPRNFVKEIVSYATENQLHLNVFVSDRLYVEKRTIWLEHYIGRNKVPFSEVGDLHLFIEENLPNRLLIVASIETLDKVGPVLRERFANQLRIVRPQPTYLVFADGTVSKGKALNYLARLYELDASQIMAIGDSENDICMLKEAGLGVAMSNATPQVKAFADYITESNNDDGVALAIEKFVLN